MAWLFTPVEAPVPEKKVSASVEMMHKLGCRICPLADSTCHHKDMRPRGTKEPVVYMLGPAPDVEDDEDDMQYSPDSRGGRILRAYLTDELEADMRWNYVVRTRAMDGHKPTTPEIECCRKSVEEDIAATQPIAIFGFGATVLSWVRPGMSLQDMRGRRFPVKIGGHTAWFYCFEDPSELRKPIRNKWGSFFVDPQREATFRFDLKRAVKDIEYEDTPVVHSNKEAFANLEMITKRNGGVKRVIEALGWAAQQGGNQGYDYETSALRPYRNSAVILSLAISGPGWAFSFGIHHRQAGWSAPELELIKEAIKNYLRAPVQKCVHNLAFELEWTGVKFGLEFIRTTTWEDSTSEAFILDERTGNKRKNGPASLHFGCRLHFDLPLKDLSPEINSDSKKNMAAVPLDTMLPYNALDAKYHRNYFEVQRTLLLRQGLWDVYRMKVSHVHTVVLTQIKGAPIDAKVNEDYFKLYQGRVDAALDGIQKSPHYEAFRRHANRHFNPASDQDMQIMLGEIIRTKIGKGEDGKYNTERETLEQIRDPIIKFLLAHRRANKALSTYVLPLRPESEHNYDGWCHTILNTTVAVTGRLSSEAPNVQNFPTRDPEMGKVRAQIAPGPGKLIMKVDYGQIEARVIAMVSKDAVFVKALWDRYDVHMAWAEKIEKHIPRILKRWDDPDDYPTMDKKMKALRTAVKNEWTFPLFFGAQLRGVAQFLQVTENELLPLREEFWDTFRGVKKWQDGLREEYAQNGEITYITGRKARGPITENQLFNYPIQGPTCDIVLDGMRRISALSAEDWNYQPIFNIHDDLTFVLPEKKFEVYAENIIGEMLAVPFDFVNVPITLEVASGPNWHDVVKDGDFSSDQWKAAA